MVYKDYNYIIPVILLIIFSFISSIFLINYLKIDINDNSGLVKLNKVAVYEGLTNKDKKTYDIFARSFKKEK